MDTHQRPRHHIEHIVQFTGNFLFGGCIGLALGIVGIARYPSDAAYPWILLGVAAFTPHLIFVPVVRLLRRLIHGPAETIIHSPDEPPLEGLIRFDWRWTLVGGLTGLAVGDGRAISYIGG